MYKMNKPKIIVPNEPKIEQPKIIPIQAKYIPTKTGVLDQFGRPLLNDAIGYRPARTRGYTALHSDSLDDESQDSKNIGILLSTKHGDFEVKKDQHGYFIERQISPTRAIRQYVKTGKTDFKPKRRFGWKQTGEVAAAIISVASGVAVADFDLQFEHYIDDGSTPDGFNAIGDANDPNVLVGYDTIKDVLQAPNPPSGDYVQAYTEPNGVPSGQHVTKDGQPFDPNLIDNTWLVKLIAFDNGFVGLTGNAHFNLKDPNDLNDLPENALAIITRMDPNGTPDPNNDIPLQNYNLDITPNISWPVAAVKGLHANIELKTIDEFLRVSRLAGDPNFINFEDLAVLVNDWQKTGPNPGDINGDNTTDFKDLEILVGYWLWDVSDL